MTEKQEPRLRDMIMGEKRRAPSAGMTAAEVESQQEFEVTISSQERQRAPEVRDESEREQGLEELGRQVEESQGPLLSKLEELGARAEATVRPLANAVTAKLTPAQMDAVAQLDEVSLIRVEKLDQVTAMNESVRVIELLEAREDLGFDGRGVRVAILDSGVDANHPALSGKVVDEMTTTPEPVNVPGDHGTHVGGTVASNDAVYRGVAPQSDLINIKVLTSGGFGQPQYVIDGLEQAVRRGALVANLSLGWSEPYHGWVCNDADCILCQAADNAARLGVTVVVAAGNEDDATANPPYQGMSNIRHPGAARRVITVGAVDKAKVLAYFSSIGPGSGRLSPGSQIRLTKPDLAAPGVDIVSSVTGGGFASLSGTSMASPHVAGVAALVLQKTPTLRPMAVKKLLEDTCEPIPGRPNEVGYGLVNVYAVLIRNP